MNGELQLCECGNDRASHYFDRERGEVGACLCANCTCPKYTLRKLPPADGDEE
jgi:hypothetical protein